MAVSGCFPRVLTVDDHPESRRMLLDFGFDMALRRPLNVDKPVRICRPLARTSRPNRGHGPSADGRSADEGAADTPLRGV
jgi:hypothetical protein